MRLGLVDIVFLKINDVQYLNYFAGLEIYHRNAFKFIISTMFKLSVLNYIDIIKHYRSCSPVFGVL